MHPLNRYFLLLLQFFLTIQACTQNQIAPVETAIPAFIGYTQKAENGWLKPQAITSMAEYVKHFGGPAWEENLQVTIKPDQQVTAQFDGKASKHNLYYSVQAYFANGGFGCYIVPVGGYLTGETALSSSLLIEGINALDGEDGPTLILIPEAQNLPDLYRAQECYNAALAQCARRRDRFAIMDIGPHGQGDDILELIKQFRQEGVGEENLSYGAVYAPNVITTIPYTWDRRTSVVWQLPGGNRQSTMGELAGKDKELYNKAQKVLSQMMVVLPPSGPVAGVYVQTDMAAGVWKAPANVALKSVMQPVLAITDSQQEQINTGKSVNAIRSFPGKGTLVWGARTLAGNDNEWRYVPVRRLSLFLEQSITKDTQWAVFEPNDEPLWAKIRSSTDNLLYELWRKGAFQGTTPKEAYFYRVGLGQTMTAQDILDGNLIIEVGFAPLKPAEFVVLRIVHKMN